MSTTVKDGKFMDAPENMRGTDGLTDTKEYGKGKNRKVLPKRTGDKSLRPIKPRK